MSDANNKLHVIEYRSGRFGYAGNVPASIAFVQKNGEAATAKQLDGARHAGAGFVGISGRAFDTRADAVAFAKAAGAAVAE
tara:strand:+ start:238 stop:480 length:243 start_codon:yes stop_codon:yes gene_type:complete